MGTNAWAAVDDTFTANTVEGVAVTYKVLTEDGTTGTVQVGIGSSGSHAISTSTEGSVTIPETVTRDVDEVTYTYTVTAVRAYAFDGCTKITSVTLPATISVVNSYAFRQCTSLVTINIPVDAQVPQINARTFYNCSSLKNITLPASVTYIDIEAFRGCSSLESFSVPSSVTAIYGGAFRGCSSLTSIDIPASVTTILSTGSGSNSNNEYYSPFDGCTSLSRVNITDVVAWNNINFVNNCHPLRKCCEDGNETALYLNGEKITHLVIPEGVTSIRQGPFLYNTGIQTVTIPSTVTYIGSWSFFYRDNSKDVGCPNLTKVIINSPSIIENTSSNKTLRSCFDDDGIKVAEIVLPEGLTKIGTSAFIGMRGLTTINIPSTVTSIEESAFSGCTGLTSLTLPSGLQYIRKNAFYDCQALTLTSGVFPSTLTTIGEQAFYNCDGLTSIEFQRGLTGIGNWAFNDCGSLASITLPTTMTSLNTGVFSGCTALTSVTIPEGFTSIGESAFNNCWGLEDVNLPSTLTSIGLYAFQDCLVLTSITIPRNVYSLRRYAFYNCPLLNDVTIQCETPPSQTTPVFRTPAEGETVTLKVPMGSESSYATNYGQYFTNIIGLPMPGQVITCDDIPYTILTSPEGDTPGTVMLGTGSYNQPAYGSSASGEITVPETVPYTSGDNTYSFNVTTLGGYAFNYCNNVTRINLPATITEIQNYALSTCSSLERLYLASATPNTTIDDYAFQDANTGNCILVVPEGSKTAYQNSVWSSIFPYIKEVGHETDWLPGDVFYATIFLGLDCEKTIPFKILTAADGDTPATVQMGIRDYDNIEPLDETEQNPSIFEKGDWCPPAITLPESVEFNNNTYTLTTLGAYVLSMMSSQYDNSKIELPSTITTIGYKAFNYSCWVNDFCAFSETAPTLIMGDDPDDDYPAPFGWSFKEATNLIVPDGCTAAYASWAPYFKNVVEKPKPVVIAGVEYKRETDIFGDGTVVISWEFEENDDIKKSPRKANAKGGSEDDEYAEYLYNEGVPVLTLNNATINYNGNGPAIEVNSFPRFYIRVKGNNSITAANAAAAISIGTNKGVDMSQTSLIFLSDDIPTSQGGGIVSPLEAPRHKARKAGAGNSNMLPSLTITNNTADGDGIYVYQGSCNVQDCDVTVTGQKYGLEFGVEESGEIVGPDAPTMAQRRNAKSGPKKVTPVNGPVGADEYSGWLNVYEASGLTLNGGDAALWGATGYQAGENEYVPGYLQNVSLMNSDKGEGESGPTFFPAGYNDENITSNGSYYIDGQNSKRIAKYLKFGCDYFIATTDEGIRMKFTVTNENPKECQVGYYNEEMELLIQAVDQYTDGAVTIPSEANGYTVTSICSGAFYQCYDINAVSIPASVESIGQYAFNGCNNLYQVTCYATTPPTLGDNVFTCSNAVLYVPATAVEAYQASNWANYFSPANILPIGGEGYVFTAKTPENVLLTFVVLGTENNTTYVQVGTGDNNNNCVVSTPNNWDGNLTIPTTVTDAGGNTYYVDGIADNALKCWDDLKSLNVGEGISYIGTGTAQYYWYGAFYACYYLTTVSLPSTINKIDNFAFNYCNSLSEVYIYATGAPTLGSSAFSSGRNTLYVLAGYAGTYEDSPWANYFYNIVEMEDQSIIFTANTIEGVEMTFKITGNNTVQTYGSTQRIYDSEYEEYYYMPVPAIPANTGGQVTIPATVEHEGVTYTVTAIGNNSFVRCPITSVTIPASVTYIGYEAFAGTHLNSVTVLNEDPDATELHYNTENKEYDAFYAPQHCKLFVPTGTLSAYQVSDRWLQSFMLIRETGDTSIGNGDIFYADNGDSEEMCFMITDMEKHEVKTYGYWAWDYAITAIRPDFSGALSIPETTTYNGVTYTVTAIGEESFDADGSPDLQITNVTIPSTITYIGGWAFCEQNLNTVTIYATTPPELNNAYLSGDVLYVPAGCADAYADWSEYFNGNIVEMGGAPATVPVTIGQYEMATFCSTQPLNFTNVAGLKAYIVSGFNPDDNNLTLTRVYSVPAGTGLVLYGNAGEYDIPVEATNSSYANMLVGCTEDVVIQPTSTVTITENNVSTEITYTNFVLSVKDNQPGFYRFYLGDTSGRTIEAGKAYLRIPTDLLSTGSSIKGFKLVFSDEDDDIITGIGEIEVSPNWSDDDIYNLSGQRLNKAQKGVNIMNGKKVLVK